MAIMWRLIGTILTVGLVGLAIWLFAEAAYQQGRCDMLRRAVVTTIPVDLSRKGTYEGTYQPLHWNGHSSLLVLRACPVLGSSDEAKTALQGLTGECRVQPSDGETTPIELDALCARWDDRLRAPFLDLRSAGGDGNSRITIRVDTPATGMPGRAHTFEVVQQFCGLESSPMFMMRALAVGCLAVAGIIELIRRCTGASRVSGS